MLVDWTGDTGHPEWQKLNEAIAARIKYHRSPQYKVSLERGKILLERMRDIDRKVEERGKARRARETLATKIHMKPGHRVTARDPGTGPITVHVQTDAGEVWVSVDRAASDEPDKLKRFDRWPVEWTVPAERGPAPFVTLVLTENDANALTFPKPKA